MDTETKPAPRTPGWYALDDTGNWQPIDRPGPQHRHAMVVLPFHRRRNGGEV